jgi:hypothetical protein
MINRKSGPHHPINFVIPNEVRDLQSSAEYGPPSPVILSEAKDPYYLHEVLGK